MKRKYNFIDLFAGCGGLSEGFYQEDFFSLAHVEINKIEYDSNKIVENDVFVAIKGYKDDGNNYLDEVISKRVRCIVVEQDVDTSKYENDNLTIIKVDNARIALAIISAVYYDNPGKKINLIGTTGTKGKTTTAYMIRDIFLYSLSLF